MYNTGEQVYVYYLIGTMGEEYRRDNIATITMISKKGYVLKYPKGTEESVKFGKVVMRKLSKLEKALK